MKKISAVILATLILSTVVPVAAAMSLPATPSDLATKEVTFKGDGGTVLHGTVLSSATAKSGMPGIVLVQGSGTGLPRTRVYPEAIAFARQGLSVLTYNKKSNGYSNFHRSYSQLANDALGAADALRSQPGVDPTKVGLWGFS